MRVGMQQLLHLEVGRGVDSVQQGPLVVEGDVGMLQFAFDGAEAAYHDVLPDGSSRSVVFPIISAWRDERSLPLIGLGVTDDDDGKHVHIFGVEVLQRGDVYFLFGSACLADVAHGCLGRAVFLQEDFLQAVELPVAAFTFGVVDSRHEICLGSSPDALLDAFPGSHQVAQGDDTEIMSYRSAQQGGRLLESADAWQRYDLDCTVPLALHLVDERRHAVDTCIARTDDADGLALFGQFKGLFGPCAFSLHARIHALGAAVQVGVDKLEVIFVAYHYISFLQGGLDGRSNGLFVARTYAGNDYFRLFHCYGFHNVRQIYVFFVEQAAHLYTLYYWMHLMKRAGTPPTMVSAGTSLVTTAPAATTALSPMVTPCRMVALEPTHTFLPRTMGAG